MRTQQCNTWYKVRAVYLGGTNTWMGGRLRSQDQMNLECGSNLVNISLQIRMLVFFCMNFALKFGGEEQKNEKDFHRKVLLRSLDLSCCFKEKNRLW